MNKNKKGTVIAYVTTEGVDVGTVMNQLTVGCLYRHYGKRVVGKTPEAITGEILVVVGNQKFVDNFAKQYGPDTTMTSLLDVVTGADFKSFTTTLSLCQYIVGILEPSETSAEVRKTLEKLSVMQPSFIKESWTVEQLLTALLTTEDSFVGFEADQFGIASTVTSQKLDGLTPAEDGGFVAVITNDVLPSKAAATAWVAEKQTPVLFRTTPSIWNSEQNAVLLPKSQEVIAKGIVELTPVGYGTTESHKRNVFSALAVAYRNALVTGAIKAKNPEMATA